MTKSIAIVKSKRFSIRIYNLCKYLCDDKKEYILSKQLLRSGTSIGANLSEAAFAISENDFIAKVYVAYKEAGETIYWLELLKDVNLLTQKEFKSIFVDCEEIIKMLSSTIKTIKSKTERKKK